MPGPSSRTRIDRAASLVRDANSTTVLPAGRVLHGVVQQVPQRPAERLAVGAHSAGTGPSASSSMRWPPAADLLPELRHDVFDQLARGRPARAGTRARRPPSARNSSRLSTRRWSRVRLVRQGGVVLPPAVLLRHDAAVQQFGEMAHRGQRRPELVRDRRDEIGLQPGDRQLARDGAGGEVAAREHDERPSCARPASRRRRRPASCARSAVGSALATRRVHGSPVSARARTACGPATLQQPARSQDARRHPPVTR